MHNLESSSSICIYLANFCRHFFFEIVNYHRIFMIHCGCIVKLHRVVLEFLKKFLRSHVYVYMCVNKHRDSVSVEECLLFLHMYTRNEIHFLASLFCFFLFDPFLWYHPIFFSHFVVVRSRSKIR